MYDFKNYNPKQAAMDETRALLTLGVKNAMANGTLPEKELPDFVVEIPNDNKNGDIASNIAMAGARVFGMAPRKIAQAIVDALPSLQDSMFTKVEIAGPGFLNLFFSDAWFAGVVLAANLNGDTYGRTDFGAGKKVNVEFVSANPTGPMHLGNARGGALGDGLAAALDWAGYDVTREFLINDAGNQIVKFGKSLATR
ncbi:MAG: arginine--tRNA ligase, partial [Ruthenibacterium sp.]